MIDDDLLYSPQNKNENENENKYIDSCTLDSTRSTVLQSFEESLRKEMEAENMRQWRSDYFQKKHIDIKNKGNHKCKQIWFTFSFIGALPFLLYCFSLPLFSLSLLPLFFLFLYFVFFLQIISDSRLIYHIISYNIILYSILINLFEKRLNFTLLSFTFILWNQLKRIVVDHTLDALIRRYILRHYALPLCQDTDQYRGQHQGKKRKISLFRKG